MIISYVLFVTKDGEELYAGTAWTQQAAQKVLATYAARGYIGKWETEMRR